MLTTEDERFIREFILQWKLGKIRPPYFLEKFGIDLQERYGKILKDWKEQGILNMEGEEWTLSREALLRVDSLLDKFFLPQHQDARYV